jgi:hypothetical protein
VGFAVRSARITTGNSSPFARCTGHDADAFGAVLDDRRLAGLAAVGVLLEEVDERAERRDAAPLGSSREVHEARHVRERLLARRPDREAGVRPHRAEEARDRLRERPAIAPHVQLAQQREPVGHLGQLGRQFGRRRAERMERRQAIRVPVRRAVREELPVAERHERPAERREDRERVVGTLDRRERGAERREPPRACGTSCRRRARAGAGALRARARTAA